MKLFTLSMTHTMFKFFSGIVLGIVLSERYPLPKLESIAQKVIKRVDEWTKED